MWGNRGSHLCSACMITLLTLPDQRLHSSSGLGSVLLASETVMRRRALSSTRLYHLRGGRSRAPHTLHPATSVEVTDITTLCLLNEPCDWACRSTILSARAASTRKSHIKSKVVNLTKQHIPPPPSFMTLHRPRLSLVTVASHASRARMSPLRPPQTNPSLLPLSHRPYEPTHRPWRDRRDHFRYAARSPASSRRLWSHVPQRGCLLLFLHAVTAATG